MGMLKRFKDLLRSNTVDLDASVGSAPLARTGSASIPPVEEGPARPARPCSAAVPRCTFDSGTAPRTALPNPGSVNHVDSVNGLNSIASLRINSVTTVSRPGSRFETTVIERQGSRLVLQGVKAMTADSDDESDAGITSASAHSRSSRNVSAAHARAVVSSTTGPGAVAAPPLLAHGQALQQQPSAFRRAPNRVASLPMLLDAGMPKAPRPMLAPDVPDPEFEGPQQAEQPRRRPPQRRESLKCLLNLDRYVFNEDVSVEQAREAACGVGAASQQGRLEDLVAAGANTSCILAVSPALPHRMQRPRWSLDDYVLLKQLHRGYASDVYQARCRVSGEMVALKVYKLAEQGDIQRMQLYREIKLHAGLRHSNVLQYYACFLEQQRVVLVTEFCTGGDLLRMLHRCGGRLMERQAVNTVLQPFLTALHYLHAEGIVHRDIKPENVFFADGNVLKLADFGLAISLKEERANTRAGTLDYMAPEVLRCPTKKTPDEGKENPQAAHYHLAADAWAVGVFAYELIVGAPPFKAAQMLDTARNIINAPVAFPESVSDLARDFISRALSKGATERLTVMEMLHHPWITMFQRRSSVRMIYARSNSLMELVPPEQQAPDGHQQPQQPQGLRPTSARQSTSRASSQAHVRRGPGYSAEGAGDEDDASNTSARRQLSRLASGGTRASATGYVQQGGGGGSILKPQPPASPRVAEDAPAGSPLWAARRRASATGLVSSASGHPSVASPRSPASPQSKDEASTPGTPGWVTRTAP